jgi:RimJ/RimL family protein N-acetyltransferase
MTEACEAVTDFWFNTLQMRVLRVPKAVANVASRRISEKSGMRIVAWDERDYVCGRLSTGDHGRGMECTAQNAKAE